MEEQLDILQMLELMVQPGFCVRDNLVTQVNQAARSALLTTGTDVRTLLATGAEEYAAFTDGCLYLSMKLGDCILGASVVRMDGQDVFLVDSDPENRELNALALAAQNLRDPLSRILLAAHELQSENSPAMGRLNRGLNQLLRMVNNMSDALMYQSLNQQEMVNLTAVFEEIFEKAQTLLGEGGLTLRYEGPKEELFSPADSQQLERAVLNVLSNAARFGAKKVTAKITKQGSLLRLSIEDDGSGIPDEILNQVFHRYLRQPGLEDSRFGIGLGMVLIRTAAANHGGTVLIDRCGGTRITMTISLSRKSGTMLRSPVFRVDYAGGMDHALMELSQVLPSEMFEKK